MFPPLPIGISHLIFIMVCVCEGGGGDVQQKYLPPFAPTPKRSTKFSYDTIFDLGHLTKSHLYKLW